MRIAIISTDLFPDREMVETSLSELEGEHEITRFDATRPELTEQDWDGLLDCLLTSDKIVTI